MTRKLGLGATRRLRVESLEARRLLAVAAFQTELYSDNGGVPGELLVDNTITAGETFFLRVTAEEFDPSRYGLRTASIDIDWDAVLLDVVESDFDLDSVITADLPLFHSGTLDNAAGSIDDLSGTAMLSGGAGRSIGNMRAETFAMIRMQAGDEAGTATIQLSKSETKTITVPSMVLQEQHLRFDAETITIVAAPPVTDSAELSTPAVTPEAVPPEAVTPESTETSAVAPVVSETDPPPPSPAPLVPIVPAAVENTPIELTLNFDANHDGVFDLADFGLLNIQADAPQAAPTDNAPVSPPVERAEQADDPSSAEVLDFATAEVNFRHTCIPMYPSDVVAAEAWMDALAEAWLADAEARRHRRATL